MIDFKNKEYVYTDELGRPRILIVPQETNYFSFIFSVLRIYFDVRKKIITNLEYLKILESYDRITIADFMIALHKENIKQNDNDCTKKIYSMLTDGYIRYCDLEISEHIEISYHGRDYISTFKSRYIRW